MRKSLTQNILRALTFALTCLALVGAEVKAATIESYSTTGSIGSTGVSNSNGDTTPGPIGFTQQVSGSFGLTSNVSLGSFAVSALSDGSTTTYDNTPFTINYMPVSDPKSDLTFATTPVTFTGVLNGTVTGNTSSVKATFTGSTSSVFQTLDGTFMSTISLPSQPLPVVAATAGALTTIEASVTTTGPPGVPIPSGSSGGGSGSNSVPEPTTFAILATAVIGFGLRQRLRSRSAA